MTSVKRNGRPTAARGKSLTESGRRGSKAPAREQALLDAEQRRRMAECCAFFNAQRFRDAFLTGERRAGTRPARRTPALELPGLFNPCAGDLVGLGVSATGAIGPTYSQNTRTLSEYYDLIDRGELPVVRGIELTPDDLLRRSVIQAFMCQFQLSQQGSRSAISSISTATSP